MLHAAPVNIVNTNPIMKKVEKKTKPDDVPPAKAAVQKLTSASKTPQERRKRAALNKTPQELAALR